MALETGRKKSPSIDEKKNLSEQMHAFSFRLGAERVTDSDRMFFTEQLALMLDVGVSLQAALQSLHAQASSRAVKKMLSQIVDDIADGKSFSWALSKHPQVFSQTYVNLVCASEAGGFIFTVLEELREMEERRERLAAKIKGALAYPGFLLLFSMAVVIFVLLVVFPKFSEMFTLIYDQLPVSTRVLMTASDVLRQQWVWVLLSIAVMTFGVRFWFRTEKGRYWLDRKKLEFPVIKHVFIQLYVIQIMRVMGLSLNRGVSVMDTLISCRDVVDNHLFQKFIRDVEQRVQSGEGIVAGFNEATFMPSVVCQLISTGDEAGSLPRVMERIATYYELQLERRLEILSRAVEPIMLIVMGGLVGVIVSSLILPIFKLSRAVG